MAGRRPDSVYSSAAMNKYETTYDVMRTLIFTRCCRDDHGITFQRQHLLENIVRVFSSVY